MAVIAAAAASVAAPSAAADVDVDLTVRGAITVSWRGDPARGCEHAGMCGDRGTITTSPDIDGELTLGRAGRGWEARGGESGGTLEPSVVVRARRDSPGEEVALCTDTPLTRLEVDVAPRGARSRLGFATSIEPLSTGACAGPTADELAEVLPSALVDLDRLRRGPMALRLAGRRPLLAGALTGEVAYDVRIRLGRMRPSDEGDDPVSAGLPAAPPGPRQTVVVAYRVERVQGDARAAFRGLREPGCELQDRCGVVGVSTYRVDRPGGRLELVGLAPPGPRRSRASLLRELRAGRLAIGGRFAVPGRSPGTVTAAVLRPTGRAGCRDSAPAPPVELELKPGATGVQVRAFAILGHGHPFRARCAGPAGAALLPDGVLARGRVAWVDLMRPRVELRLGADRRFNGEGYAGERTAAMTVGLRRESISVAGGTP